MQTSLNDRLPGMIDAGPGRVRELAPIFETACYPVGHGSQDGCLRRLATGCLAPHLVSPDCSPSADARPDLRCRPETAIKGRLDTPAAIGQRTHRRLIVHELARAHGGPSTAEEGALRRPPSPVNCRSKSMKVRQRCRSAARQFKRTLVSRQAEKPCSARLPQLLTKRAQSRTSETKGQTESVGLCGGSAPVQSYALKPLAFLGFSALHAAAEKVALGRVGGGRVIHGRAISYCE